jgi:hypothetical protein
MGKYTFHQFKHNPWYLRSTKLQYCETYEVVVKGSLLLVGLLKLSSTESVGNVESGGIESSELLLLTLPPTAAPSVVRRELGLGLGDLLVLLT